MKGIYEHEGSERANELKKQSLYQSYWITAMLHVSYRAFGASGFFIFLLVSQTTSASEQGPLLKCRN